jgi:hypothetical protein
MPIGLLATITGQASQGRTIPGVVSVKTPWMIALMTRLHSEASVLWSVLPRRLRSLFTRRIQLGGMLVSRRATRTIARRCRLAGGRLMD